MRERIPFLLYGDGPRLPTGLARIARDLAMRLVVEQEELGIRFAQVGVDYPGGWQWQPWDFCGFQPNPEDQGREAVGIAIEELTRECGRIPIVFMIMDPARCYDLTRYAKDVEGESYNRLDAEFWGYYPLDAENRLSTLGGPAALAIQQTDRLCGYGRYGAGLLKRTRAQSSVPVESVSYLPHGIETHVFTPGVSLLLADQSFREWAERVPSDAIKLGCVATNQPRKDLGLLFSTVAELNATQRRPVVLWLHTDKPTSAWDIGELAITCGLSQQEIAVSVEELTDLQLAARYGWSDLTIAPGLGEGFGYPIVESLACGIPVIHGNYAGGVELIPDPAWLLEPVAWRLESVYALLRPVFSPKAAAACVQQVLQRMEAHPTLMRAYCAGAVAHLNWEHLWTRWRRWISQGLEASRGTRVA